MKFALLCFSQQICVTCKLGDKILILDKLLFQPVIFSMAQSEWTIYYLLLGEYQGDRGRGLGKEQHTARGADIC